MSDSKLVPEQVLLLEQGLFRTPTEQLKTQQKVFQRTFEHNLGPSSAVVKRLKQATPVSAAETDALLVKLRNTRKRLQVAAGQYRAAHAKTRARLEYVRLMPPSVSSEAYQPWAEKRLSLHLVDFFLRHDPPLVQTARQLAADDGITDLVDFGLWEAKSRVEAALRRKDLQAAFAYVAEHKSALKKSRSPLEFYLHIQQVVELCRARDCPAAISYFREHITALVIESTTLSDDERSAALLSTSAVLAFDPASGTHPFYAEARWQFLLDVFRSTFYAQNSLPQRPVLDLALQMGLSSLKTYACFSTVHPDTNIQCPTCASPLRILSRDLPYAHHMISSIVCPITREVSNNNLLAFAEDNYAYVFSEEGLQQYARELKSDKAVNPVTKHTQEWSSLRKVFIS